MIPFLWIGYGLRFFIEKVNKFAVAGLLFSYGVMYYFWDISYSVYVTPFHIWDADMDTFFHPPAHHCPALLSQVHSQRQ